MYSTISPTANNTIAALTQQLDGGMRVYQHYAYHGYRSGHVVLRKKAISPLRPDEKDPSFCLYENRKTGDIWWTDFGMEGKGANCYTLVMKLFGLEFKQAVAKIKQDVLGISDGDYIPSATKVLQYASRPKFQPVPIRYQPHARPLTKHDLAFWKQFLVEFYWTVEEQLAQANVYPIHKYEMWKQDPETGLVKHAVINASPSDPIYCIDFNNGRYKFYRPLTLNRKFKWLSNTIGDIDLFMFHLLPSQATNGFITAGNKDTLAFRALLGPDTACFALNSESANLTAATYQYIQMIAPNWFSITDKDTDKVIKRQDGSSFIKNTGRESAEKLQAQWNIKPANQLITEQDKDFAGMLKPLIMAGNTDELKRIADHYRNLQP